MQFRSYLKLHRSADESVCDWCGRPATRLWRTCCRPVCRALREAWRVSAVLPPREFAYGPHYNLWFMAEFLRKMAVPTTERQREFAKRFKGSRENRRAHNGPEQRIREG